MIKSHNTSTLFLDIGGVLLTNGWGHEARALAAKKFDLDPDDLNRRHERMFAAYEVGDLTLDQYLSRAVFYRKRNFSRRRFREFMFAQSKPHPQMIDLIRRLKKAYGLKVAAVTNEGRELMLHRVRTFRLERVFDFFVASCFVHLRKPDRRIYQTALDISQTPVRNVLYIDDRRELVEAARKLGIRGFRHQNIESTISKLRRFGLRTD